MRTTGPLPQSGGMLTPYSRRSLLGFVRARFIESAPCAGGDPPDWMSFKSRFVTPEGRVRDTVNGDISHSEGQAWCMLVAALRGDAETFQRVQGWTYRVLGIRPDALLAWRYRPGPAGGVDDMNNASDADLFHAYALLLAHARWPNRGYYAIARRVAAAVRGKVIRQLHGRRLLLPGVSGFEFARHVDINPSYYVFAALDALDCAFPGEGWADIARDGEALIAEARFGRFGLPPDWLRIDRHGGAMYPMPNRGDRFGYDAIRVPLNMVWGGRHAHPAVAAAARFWSDPGFHQMPAWVRLSTGEVSPYPAGIGIAAIADLVLGRAPRDGAVDRSQAYYDVILALLAREARIAAGRQSA